MKKNKIKKIITISAVVLLLIATLGTFAAFFGKNDFAKVKDKWNDVKDKFQQEEVVSSVNIVKNSNFKINTTGTDIFTEETSSGNGVSLVDNWKLNAGSSSTDLDFIMYQVDEGFYVRNDGGSPVYLSQIIEEGIALYANKELTLTVSIDDVVYSASGVLTENDRIQVNINSMVDSHVAIYISNNTCSIGVSLRPGANSIINWVQLEEGNVFTGYVPPVIAE